MLVKDVMTNHAEWIRSDATLRDVARKMRDHNIGCLPVGENDRLIGIITDRDIACRGVAEGLDPKKTTAKDVMSNGITYCFDDQTDDEAAALMDSKGYHHLPVLSRQKRIVGIVSLGDLALKSAKSLREKVMHMASRDAARHAA